MMSRDMSIVKWVFDMSQGLARFTYDINFVEIMGAFKRSCCFRFKEHYVPRLEQDSQTCATICSDLSMPLSKFIVSSIAF